MAKRIVTLVLAAGLVYCSVVLAGRLRTYPLPGNQQGYEPEQPIAFSHKQHAGDLQISCVYCHFGAETSRRAGVPPAATCMTCHRFVTAPQRSALPEILEARKEKRTPRRIVSPELQKLYDALALDPNMEPDPKKSPKPIAWLKVHNLPAFACFDHRSHVNAGVACQKCHGEVQTMERVRQVSDLSMGWCIDCHREPSRAGVESKTAKPSTDCAACHN